MTRYVDWRTFIVAGSYVVLMIVLAVLALSGRGCDSG